MVASFDVPDELDLISFFGVDPLERVPDDGFWCFCRSQAMCWRQ